MTGRIRHLARLRRIASDESHIKEQSHTCSPRNLSQVHQPPTTTSTLPKLRTAELSLVRTQPLHSRAVRPVLGLQKYSTGRFRIRGPESRNFSDAVVTLADGRTLLKQFASLKQLSRVVATKLGLDTKWEAAMTGARATKLDSDFSAFETACENSNRKGFACLADALSDADFRRSPRTLLVQRNEPSSSDVFTIELRVRWDKGARIRLQLPPMKYPILAFENTTTGASCITVRLYADCPAEHNNDPSSKPTSAMLIPQEVAFLTDAVDMVVDRICQAATFDNAKWAAAALAAAILKFVAFRTASLPLYTVRVHIDPHRPNGGHAIAFRSTRPGLDPRLRNDDAEIQVQAFSNSTERAEGEKRDNSEQDDTDERASCHQNGSVSSEAIKPDGEASSHLGDMAVSQDALPQSREHVDGLVGLPARVTEFWGKTDDEAATGIGGEMPPDCHLVEGNPQWSLWSRVSLGESVRDLSKCSYVVTSFQWSAATLSAARRLSLAELRDIVKTTISKIEPFNLANLRKALTRMSESLPGQPRYCATLQYNPRTASGCANEVLRSRPYVRLLVQNRKKYRPVEVKTMGIFRRANGKEIFLHVTSYYAPSAEVLSSRGGCEVLTEFWKTVFENHFRPIVQSSNWDNIRSLESTLRHELLQHAASRPMHCGLGERRLRVKLIDTEAEQSGQIGSEPVAAVKMHEKQHKGSTEPIEAIWSDGEELVRQDDRLQNTDPGSGPAGQALDSSEVPDGQRVLAYETRHQIAHAVADNRQQESNHGNRLDDSEVTSAKQERHQGEHHFDAVVENTPGLFDGQQEPLWRKNVILALGSNVGDRFKNIEDACDKLDECDDIRVVETSPLYETEPMYVEDQGRFLNGACAIETTLKPMELLDRLQAIENDLGRVKFIDKGPRNIDLDIIAYDQEVVDNERLTVPHRLMTEREFVLRPFARLQASFSWRHPITQLTAKDHLDNLPVSATPMTSVTPLSPLSEPLRAMDPSRQTRIMSILNVTPDSFSDGGVHVPTDLEALKATVASHIAAGATIIDIGGQSSRPNAPDITAEEEIARILPAIEAIKSLPEATNISISIDTYRAAVAEAAIKAGAHIINDVSAGLLDPDMLSTIARLKCTYIMMHMRGTPATMQSSENTSYPLGVLQTVRNELIERVDAAQRAGVRLWRIILDPGFGFAKTLEQNLDLLRTFSKLRRLRLRNLPWLVGISRKGFIGKITGTEVAAERVGGTAVTVSRAVMVGADIVRVHDVEIMRQAVRMTEAIYRTCRSEEEQ